MSGDGLLAGVAHVDVMPKMDGFGAKLGAEMRGVISAFKSATVSELDAGLKDIGGAATNLGGTLTKGLTVPLVGAAGAATAMFAGFETSMANVATLMPGQKARVEELSDTVLSMSSEVGKSTDDLADGLYMVVSAFGDTADSATILETNAKAATAGLATTTDAINLTSAVTKAYGDTSADAVQQASDLALMTVRLGQTTFPELAGSIGVVTPLTSQLGISMEELFGTMATFTGVTGGASEVSTQLRGVLQSLLAPTESMSGLMEELGYANGEAMIQSLGLQGTVEAIVGAAEKSGAPLQDYIGSIEGQTIALAGAGAQSEDWLAKTSQMADVAGTTDEAFAEVADTTQFKLTNALNRAKEAGVEFGEVIAPMVEGVADGVVGMLDAFADLPTPIRDGAVVVGGLAAAAGPAAWGLGKIAEGAGSAISAVKGGKEQFDLFRLGMEGASQAGDGLAAALGRNLTPALVGAGGVVAAVGIAALAWEAHSRSQQEARARADELRGAIDQQTGAITENADALLLNKFQSQNQMDDLGRAGVAWSDVTGAIESQSDVIDKNRLAEEMSFASKEQLAAMLRDEGGARNELIATLVEEGEANGGLLTNLYDQFAAYDAARQQIDATADATRDAHDATDRFGGGMGTLGANLRDAAGDIGGVGEAARDAAFDIDRLNGLLFGPADAEIGYQSALLAEEEAKARIGDAEKELTDARNEHGWVSEEAADAERNLKNAQLDLQRAQMDTVRSALDLQGALSAQSQSADELHGQFGDMQGRLADLAAQFPEVTDNAWLLSAALNDLERERVFTLRVNELWEGGIFGGLLGAKSGGALGNLFGAITGGVAGIGRSIPAAADGAFVSATPGGSLVRVGEAGDDEAIVPLRDDVLDRLGGGGMHVEQTVHHHYQGIPADRAVEMATTRMKRDLASAIAAAMVGG